MESNYTIASYLRLSLDDDKDGDSASIIGQRELILSRITSMFPNQEYLLLEFSDDGYSGTNFNRPGVQKLLNEVKSGNVQCIIVKDLSRFGRNYVEVGNYLERVFPFLGVRVISINDNYDSDTHKGSTGGIDIPFRNLLYDLYSKDISRKVLSSKMMKLKNGEFTSPYAPYGYLKDPNDNKNLLVDTSVAHIVLRIFQEVVDGKTTREIAVRFNEEGILTPMLYKQSQGLERGFNNSGKTNVWNSEIIRRTIHDERYTGTFVGGKNKQRIRDDKRCIRTKKEEWVVIKNRFEAIVPEELYVLANQNIKAKSKKSELLSDSNKIFAKKVRCSNCELLMEKKGKEGGHYFCKTAKFAKCDCFDGKLYEKDLINILLPIIIQHMNLAISLQELREKQKAIFQKKQLEKNMRIKSIEDEIEKSDNLQFELYEKYLLKKITKEYFLRHKEYMQSQLETNKKKLIELKSSTEIYEENIKKNNHIIDIYKNKPIIETITRELVDRVIDTIWVNPDGSIDIKFNYEDPINT
ncbi:MAG: recombinase family protein [Lachnospiraceae bacterium]